MAESSLTPTYTELQAILRDFVGEAAKGVDAAIKAGCRMALAASGGPNQKGRHKWSFLSPYTTLTIWPSIAVEAGVTLAGSYVSPSTTITLTYGTSATRFYPSMVGHDITITGVGTFTVTSYTSATVIVVSGDAHCTTKTFAVTANGRYSLPDDFGSLASDFYYPAGVSPYKTGQVTEDRLRAYLVTSDQTGDPTIAAVMPRPYSAAHNPATDTKWDAWFWPIPGTLRVLTYKYNICAEALDGTTYITALGGPDFGNLLVLACLGWAEIMWKGGAADNMKLYQMELDRMILDDAAKTTPRNLGYMGDTSDESHGPVERVRINNVTYTER